MMRRFVAIFLTSCILTRCYGQRSALNLGSKLKKKVSSQYVSEELEAEFVVEGDTVHASKGLESVDLAFEDILVTLDTKKGEKKLLDGSIRGRAKPGRMLAIMGPSGAGKSTLLHAIAGRLKDSKKIEAYGRRYVNGEPVAGESQVPAAFIEQDVNFFPYMTVRETLKFRVALKLGSILRKEAREKVVDDLMKQLGLTQVANTIVGDTKVRGISGGERKRLSIAVEMISSPSVIFLDEPTSGLDSAAAAALVENLRLLADMGKTVIAVIHQPSHQVFSQFDDLLLVSQGKQVYFGEVKSVRTYMEWNGCKASSEVGTAEHILDCIAELQMVGESEQDAQDRINSFAELATNQQFDIGASKKEFKTKKKHRYSDDIHSSGPRANILVQTRLLLARSFKDILRGKGALLIKGFQQITVGVIYGGIYKLGTNQASIQDRFGLISLLAIGAANLAIASTIRTFPKEKSIVSNEIASKMYRTFPYFIGKAISEIPQIVFFNAILGVSVYKLAGMNQAPGKFRNFITLLSSHGFASQSLGLMLGAISPSSDVALALFPAVLILNIIFDGRNISQENTPKFLRWISKVGLIRWGFEGLSINEFDGLEFDAGGPFRGPVAKTGNDALARLGMGENTLHDVFRAQAMVTAGCWAMSYLGITLTRQKFAVMKVPQNGNNGNGK